MSDDTQVRMLQHLEESAPNPNKPKLLRQIEEDVAEINSATRRLYVACKEICHLASRVERYFQEHGSGNGHDEFESPLTEELRNGEG